LFACWELPSFDVEAVVGSGPAAGNWFVDVVQTMFRVLQPALNAL